MLPHHHSAHLSYRAFALCPCPVLLLKYSAIKGFFNLLPSCLSQMKFSRRLPSGIISFLSSLLPGPQSLPHVQLHSSKKTPKADRSGCCSALIFPQPSQFLPFAAVSFSSNPLENVVSFFLFLQLSGFLWCPIFLQKTLTNVSISHS